MGLTDTPEPAGDERTGVLAGIGAYTLWGMFPLVFRQLDSVGAGEILLHRVVWSFVVVMVVLGLRGDRHWFDQVRSKPGGLLRLGAAGGLIAVNWLVYIWAVNNGHVVEAALGYYINPLLTVALGVVVLGERLRRAQVLALVFAASAVAVLTLAYGRVPWVALTLACSFAGYGFLKKAVSVGATAALAVETAVLLLPALAALTVLGVRGDLAFLHGSVGRDVLLVSLGVVTAVPLLLFGTAASRIPLSLLGLLQYLTPTMQFLLGILVFDEELPRERLAGFVLVWVALVLLGVDAVRTSRRRLDQPLPIAEPA
ncbi:MAG: EamA family transporter RarD [Acidimicrobiales bacterium]